MEGRGVTMGSFESCRFIAAKSVSLLLQCIPTRQLH